MRDKPRHSSTNESGEHWLQVLAICKKIVEVERKHLKIKMVDLSLFDIYPLPKHILLAISLKTELRGYRRPSNERTSDSEDSDLERKFIFTTDSDSENVYSSESDLETDLENFSTTSDTDSED